MPTECSAYTFKFEELSDRVVVAGFDGRAITSDAGALLLGATDPTIQLTERFRACFTDRWSARGRKHRYR
nr:transposase [Acidiphilium multivorum]